MIFSRKKVTILVILWLFLSSLIIASIYRFFNPEVNLLILKDVFIVAFFILLIADYRSLKLYTINHYIAFLLLYLIVQFILSNAPFFAKLAGLRQMLVPFLLIYIGMSSKIGTFEFVKFKRGIIKIAIFVVLFGYYEIIFSIWHEFELKNYFEAKNVPVYGGPKEAFYNYPPFFIEPIFGGVKRMTATLLDPINLGHTLVFILSLILFDKTLGYNRDKKLVLVVFFGTALILTFSKGALLHVILVALFNFRKISIGIKVLVMFLFTLLLFYMSNFHQGIKIHLSGIENAIKSLKIFGHGIAKTGNQATMFFEQTVDIGDTFIGSIMGQIGFLGLVLWLIPFYIIYQKIKDNIVAKILLAQLIISIISENAFNLLSVFLICISVGVVYRLNNING